MLELCTNIPRSRYLKVMTGKFATDTVTFWRYTARFY